MQKSVEINSNNLTLRGMLNVPDNVQGKLPVVVIFHGFLGNKMGPHFIFVKLSKLLAQRGIASIRFDFGGSGESDGEFADMTFSGEFTDAVNILNYVKSLEFIDTEKISVLGLSMGGAVASMLAGERKSDIHALSLWAPAGNMGEVTQDFFIGDRKDEFLENGYLDLDGLIMGKKFVEDVTSLDIYEKASRYDKKVLLLHGDNDEVVSIKASKRYKELYGRNGEFHILKGANHTFDKKEWEDEVFKHTIDFFEKELGNN
jgi:alpha/beta superfamily hydrolase